MIEKYTYINVNPAFTEEEIKIFDIFNDILRLNSQLKVNGWGIYVKDANYPSNFEVINNSDNKQTINSLDKSIYDFKKHCNTELYLENLDLVINYNDLFSKTEIIHVNILNYKINCYSSNLYIHLMKFIHFFHHDGLFKKLFNISIQGHTFSTVISEGANEDSYILEGTDIYDTILLDNGYYQKKNNLSLKSEEFLSNINKKIIFDKLSNDLHNKNIDSKLQKI